jgi:hypothetical protein
MVSELASNCIRFTPGGFSVSIEDDSRRVLVGVTDSGGGEPTIRSPRPTDLSGRGLRIVEAMSDDWGVIPAESSAGTTVWFTLMRGGGAASAARTAAFSSTPIDHRPQPAQPG